MDALDDAPCSKEGALFFAEGSDMLHLVINKVSKIVLELHVDNVYQFKQDELDVVAMYLRRLERVRVRTCVPVIYRTICRYSVIRESMQTTFAECASFSWPP